MFIDMDILIDMDSYYYIFIDIAGMIVFWYPVVMDDCTLYDCIHFMNKSKDNLAVLCSKSQDRWMTNSEISRYKTQDPCLYDCILFYFRWRVKSTTKAVHLQYLHRKVSSYFISYCCQAQPSQAKLQLQLRLRLALFLILPTPPTPTRPGNNSWLSGNPAKFQNIFCNGTEHIHTILI